MRATIIIALALAAPAARAQDCGPTANQLELNFCAAAEHDRADAELNQVYGLAIEAARRGGAAAEEALRQAQRAWIPFRDRTCEAEGASAEGGSMQPMLVALCLARVTRERTAELRALAGG